jgi:hypothetical protein
MYYEEESDDSNTDYDEIYEDFDETFPDEEEDEVQIEGIEQEPILPGGRIVSLLDDPYPVIGIPIILIGFIIVLLTPNELWAIFRYFIAANYLLLILAAAATFFALRVWYSTSTGWLRYGGPTNILVIWVTVGLATADLISWMLAGVSILGLLEPLVSTGLVIVLFCFYSLWLIQRSLERE